MAANLSTNALSAAAVTARNAEYAGTPFTDIVGDGKYNDPYLGGNRAGSCAPGIGIATNEILLTAAQIAAGVTRPASWTRLDQFNAGRAPQDSSHIAGINAAAPKYEGVQYPTPAQGAVIPITGIIGQSGGTPDYNDTMALVVSDVASAAAGVEFDTVSKAVNRGQKTILIGDMAWGAIPVA